LGHNGVTKRKNTGREKQEEGKKTATNRKKPKTKGKRDHTRTVRGPGRAKTRRPKQTAPPRKPNKQRPRPPRPAHPGWRGIQQTAKRATATPAGTGAPKPRHGTGPGHAPTPCTGGAAAPGPSRGNAPRRSPPPARQHGERGPARGGLANRKTEITHPHNDLFHQNTIIQQAEWGGGGGGK